MRAVDLIRKKRDSQEHSREEINFLISGYTRGEIPDYQMSAWLMATWIRGLSGAEIASLTEAMLHSGEVITFPELLGKKSRQTFHRWRRRQNFAHPRTNRRRWRPIRSDDQRTRPRPYRRHTR